MEKKLDSCLISHFFYFEWPAPPHAPDTIGERDLVAHDPREVFQNLLECSELFRAHCYHSTFEEAVVVDEETNLKKTRC